mmetsp:Transcript_41074/g.85515  ORF Transcript_41074/g.85515 Transcript_41074/m.85515 type:complete len:157 (-) Transcript_41074:384-854(-)|eukprot:CAMPEP_0172444058 /NCGR_PEP_ID=MMETSP1065-20121228/4189_1 /TAXON_ID=265537 /ORGANISM="Amphiprora paludosa, Strain CCMP125" /LENGTH=156 /DNA_ID=CAMNT_0013194477 /DNA_START=105 /DNA_END=575 /DNA_ORIENTATION=+
MVARAVTPPIPLVRTKRGVSMTNQGTMMASSVDSEIAKFRSIQEELKKMQNDLAIVLKQETENEMVMIELDILNEPVGIFKLLGPVLIPQGLDDSRQTVRKRLEFIRSEKERLQKKIAQKEHSGEELAKKISNMQANLQRTTVDAVRQIQAQHGGQ